MSEIPEAKIEIFTSPTCPFCPGAVKAAKELSKEREDFKIEETSTGTEKGRKRANSLDVRSVPTLFITGPGTEERIGYIGVPSKQALNKMLNIALGKEKWESKEGKEGLFSKIIKKIGG